MPKRGQLYYPAGRGKALFIRYFTREKAHQLGIDVSFAVCDESGLLRYFQRFGQALVLSVTLVPGKAYTSAVTQSKTKDVAQWAKEGGSLMAIESNNPALRWWPADIRCLSTGKLPAASA